MAFDSAALVAQHRLLVTRLGSLQAALAREDFPAVVLNLEKLHQAAGRHLHYEHLALTDLASRIRDPDALALTRAYAARADVISSVLAAFVGGWNDSARIAASVAAFTSDLDMIVLELASLVKAEEEELFPAADDWARRAVNPDEPTQRISRAALRAAGVV